MTAVSLLESAGSASQRLANSGGTPVSVGDEFARVVSSRVWQHNSVTDGQTEREKAASDSKKQMFYLEASITQRSANGRKQEALLMQRNRASTL